MKTIEIFGDNYFGEWDNERIACRGLILDGSQVLLSYETANDKWMIPGGGLEENESDRDCCIREIAEETGVVAELSECFLEINEYYEDFKWTNRYFVGRAVGHTEVKQTRREQEAGMFPRWIPIEQMMTIFGEYDQYVETDEKKRGVYFREYTAVTALFEKESE